MKEMVNWTIADLPLGPSAQHLSNRVEMAPGGSRC